MKWKLTLILLIIQLSTAIAQGGCKEAAIAATNDYNKGNYTFHSIETLPVENTYHYVLKEDYHIKWRFVEDYSAYYRCYDSVQTTLLKTKYGKDFLDKAERKSDSLEQTEHWITEPVFPGGKEKLDEYVRNNFTVDSTENIGGLKILVQFTVTETGKVINVKVKAISKSLEKSVARIFEEMPSWRPAYLYGKPITASSAYLLYVDYK